MFNNKVASVSGAVMRRRGRVATALSSPSSAFVGVSSYIRQEQCRYFSFTPIARVGYGQQQQQQQDNSMMARGNVAGKDDDEVPMTEELLGYWKRLITHKDLLLAEPARDYFMNLLQTAPPDLRKSLASIKNDIGEYDIDIIPRDQLRFVVSKALDVMTESFVKQAQNAHNTEQELKDLQESGKTTSSLYWFENDSLIDETVPGWIKDDIFEDMKKDRPEDRARALTGVVTDKDWVYGVHPSQAPAEEVEKVRRAVDNTVSNSTADYVSSGRRQTDDDKTERPTTTTYDDLLDRTGGKGLSAEDSAESREAFEKAFFKKLRRGGAAVGPSSHAADGPSSSPEIESDKKPRRSV